MIYLNYTNLDAETQERLLENSKADIKRQYGEALKTYSEKNHISFDTLLEEEAIKNLYSYQYVFNI